MSSRWAQIAGEGAGPDYAARMAEALRRMQAEGEDVHGEAHAVVRLLKNPPGVGPDAASAARVLDAGCGTGRVGSRLAELGLEVIGVDLDDSMLDVARADDAVTWVHGDLAALPSMPEVTDRAPFGTVVAAGNVIPLLGEGRLAATLEAVAGVLAPGGVLVAGFGLDPEHLPAGVPAPALREVDEACSAAGLELVGRWAAWPDAGVGESVSDLTCQQAGYAVSAWGRQGGMRASG